MVKDTKIQRFVILCKNQIGYMPKFGVISLTGLAIDCSIFYCLYGLVLFSAFFSSAISSTAAIAFVYFAAAFKLFHHGKNFLLIKFLVWLGYQALVISVVSLWIEKMSESDYWVFSSPFTLKLIPVPFTFILNSLFSYWLLSESNANRLNRS